MHVDAGELTQLAEEMHHSCSLQVGKEALLTVKINHAEQSKELPAISASQCWVTVAKCCRRLAEASKWKVVEIKLNPNIIYKKEKCFL